MTNESQPNFIRHDQRIETVELELKTQSSPEHAPNNDERIAAFCRAAGKLLRKNDEYLDLIDDTLTYHATENGGITPSHAVNLMLRAPQKQLLKKHEEKNYPKAYTDDKLWYKDLSEMVNNPDTWAELFIDMRRNVSSNVSERYKAFKAIFLVLQERFNQPRVLDIGSSQNQGLKKLGLNLPFEPVNVIEPILDHSERGYHLGTHEEAEEQLNQLLQTPLQLGPSSGVDFFTPDDPMNRDWAKACSFYPSELLDDNKLAKYDAIDQIDDVPNVDFIASDIFELEPKEVIEKYEEPFDVITVCTMMYQLSKEERIELKSKLREFTKEDGLIIYQDFVAKDAKSPAELYFYKHWFGKPYRYRTIVEDLSAPSIGLQEVFRWENGRCGRVHLCAGRLSLQGAVGTIEDFLLTT